MTKKVKTKISENMVAESYEIGKKFYSNQISLKDGVKLLKGIGMNSSSAVDYIYNYSNLIQGKLFTRTTNSFATEYYLERIYSESNKSGLEKALLSLSQHLDYYEDQSGSPVKKRRDVYNKYLTLLNIDLDSTIYPDELDKTKRYFEGNTKQVLINTYERNPVARNICLNYYGVTCQVCEFNFEKTFGEIGKGFIHIHHIVDISTIGEEYSVDPIKDLIPVCPNCHAMLHKQKPAYRVEEVKAILRKSN